MSSDGLDRGSGKGGRLNQVGRATLPARNPYPFEIASVKGATFEGYRRRLPHWRLDGSIYFVTWRIHPSQPDLSECERTLTLESLKFFDERRYRLLAYVVMNDHIHLLVQPFPGHSLEKLTHSWKSYIAHEAQAHHHRRGSLWQDESFDRIVRDETEFHEKFHYILNNPTKRWPDLDNYKWVGKHESL